ncbi:hypothetical protein PINS_up014793 [Pythium insidiosum]|nr:hypothetical protein PINS_up014793 [Pythium insidiosum]
MLEAGLPSLQATGGTDSPTYAGTKGFTKFDIPGEFNNVIYNPSNDKYRVDWIDKPYMWLGKLVGGCSSINAALYFRTADNYVDKAAWPFSADQVSNGFDAVETFTKVTETPSTDGEAYIQEGYEVVKGALEGIGYSAKKSLNDASTRNGRNHSFGHPPYAIRNGLRDSPAKTCLTPLLQRKNFKLMTGAKVLYVQHRKGVASAVAFETNDNQEQKAALSPRGVVILAAGALSTPAILMQSGIGPKSQLESLVALGKFPGVAASKDDWVLNENVGRNVFDTLVMFASLTHPKMTSFTFKPQPEPAISQYMKDQSGPWATPGPVLVAYETTQRGGREIEFQTTVLPHGFGAFQATPNSYTMSFYVNNPKSRDMVSFGENGQLRVATKGTWYGSVSDDVDAMTWYAHKMLSAAQSSGSTWLDAKTSNFTKEDVSAWVKSKLGSVVHHFGGSCYTSRDNSDKARCADDTFKVIGTSNVYISDASLMKEGTVNPYAFVMYIGHQAGSNVLTKAFKTTVSPSPTTKDGANGDVSPPPSSSSGSASAMLSSLPLVWIIMAAFCSMS